jgi:hypothetical protein
MSELKVNKISPRSGTDVTLGDSGDTFTIPTGASLTSPGLTLSDNLLFNTASKGIYLGVTSATASNLLDDYEEGTWTPTVIGTTVAGTATYTTQLGRYTKIGNIVNLYFAVNWSSGTGTGNLRISGLPFSAINGTNSSYYPTGMLAGNSLTFSVNTPYIAVVNNSALIEVGQMSSGATNVKVAYDSSANINGSITYETN